MITKILPNIHTSPETAFVVADYPYGFRLRCKIRYWMETNKKGTRFCSQTTNPKKVASDASGKVVEFWNKPKASTYSECGAMYLDENNHVQWTALNQYSELPAMKQFIEKFGENMTNFSDMKKIVKSKEIFEEELAKFTPRPEYGTALFNHAYLGAQQRIANEVK